DSTPARPADGAEDGPDRATAVFGTLRADRGEDSPAPRTDDDAADPVRKPRTGDSDGDVSGPDDGPEDGPDDGPADDESRGEDSADDSGNGPEAGEPAGGGADAERRPVDQPTAMFRAIRPPGERAKGPEETGKPAAGESGEPEGGKPGAGKPAAGEPDKPAPGRAGRAEKAEQDGRTESADSGKTGPEQAAKPATAKPVTAKPVTGKAGPEESPAERTSTFVPLQSAEDAPRAPKSSSPPKPSSPPEAPSWVARNNAGPSTGAGTGVAPGAGAGAQPAPTAPRRPEERPWAAGTAEPGSEAEAGDRPSLGEAERTRQQPLPPLDLLAQLTNTPPPPETPLRTVLRRIKIWTPLAVILAILFAIAQAVRPLPDPTLQLTAPASFAFEGEKPSLPWSDEGQAYVEIDGLGSLGSSGKDKPVPIASIAKVMTAYVILRDHSIDKGGKGATITVDAQAVRDFETGRTGRESVVKVTEGQKLSQYEALEALMLPSANNVARLLARWDSKGDEDAFVDKMNDAAADLGMKNTHFTDPSGLTKSTVSTARDLVKLGKEAMEDPVFKEISAKPFYTDSNGEKQLNYNRLIPYTGIGIKTGTSTAAGGNLLFAAVKEIAGTEQLIVGAVLGQYKVPAIDTVTEVSKQLIESAGAALVDADVVKKGDVVGHVDDGLGGTTPLVATEDVTAVGWPGLTVELALNDGGDKVPHEAKAGDKVGFLTVGSGPVKVPVALQKDKAEPGFGDKLGRIT
ncbi:MAG TPA: D-alanyl-D-alanine carboxypeptidase, partial [Streptomyces sp.]|nr:D-alanyl-D-alanine carboxypeptidase [Streptomyces sp.]